MPESLMHAAWPAGAALTGAFLAGTVLTGAIDGVTTAVPRRSLLVVTGTSVCGVGDGDGVHLRVDGGWETGEKVAGCVKATFRIPNSSMPFADRLYGCEFPDVPEGLVRIQVRCASGGERYYCVMVGSGYSIPWHACWRYRGWEAHWCGR
jgi:hypothetical protein